MRGGHYRPVTRLSNARASLPPDEINAHQIVPQLCDGLTLEACGLAAAEGVELGAGERVAFEASSFGRPAARPRSLSSAEKADLGTPAGVATWVSLAPCGMILRQRCRCRSSATC